jgi:uncharacterized membrane protein YkvA (DUF1232 family)
MFRQVVAKRDLPDFYLELIPMAKISILKQCENKVQSLKAHTYALYLSYRHPDTPWYAKFLIICVVGYALSPIDLIPDFIPVIGHLDDLILIPLGISIAIKLIPRPVWIECLAEAQKVTDQIKSKNWPAAGIIITIWLLLFVSVIIIISRYFLIL